MFRKIETTEKFINNKKHIYIMRLKDLAIQFLNGELNESEFVDKVNAETETLTYEEMAAVCRAFQILFRKSVAVVNKVIRKHGKNATLVTLPKFYVDRACTVIIWPRDSFEGKDILIDRKAHYLKKKEEREKKKENE